MSEDHLLESIARDDSTRVGRGPVFPPSIGRLHQERRRMADGGDGLFARLSAGESQARTGQPLCDAAHAQTVLVS
jgi:hypothetical protein